MISSGRRLRSSACLLLPPAKGTCCVLVGRMAMLGSVGRAALLGGPAQSVMNPRRRRLGAAPLVTAQGQQFRTVKIRTSDAVRPVRRDRVGWERSIVPVRQKGSGTSALVSRLMEDAAEMKIEQLEPLARIDGVSAVASRAEQWLRQSWGQLESRHRVIAASSLAFMLCNLDKVTMSVAIIPMARDFGWGASVSGLVQSSFFAGYILSQLPGGYLCSKFNGRKVLPVGVGLWALATASVPPLASTVPGLCAGRAAVGLGEAVAPSAITDMVARAVPKTERSRAIAFVFGGLHVGSIFGLLLAPFLIEHFGWPSVFFFSGASAVTWVVLWEKLVAHMKTNDPDVYKQIVRAFKPAQKTEAAAPSLEAAVPWRAILRSEAVRALMFTHFCNNWFQYTFLAWLPSYFTSTLGLDLPHAAQVALLPPIAGILTSSAAGPLADFLVAKGWETTTVRKAAQCMAFLGPAACLTATAFTTDSTLKIGLITSALGLASFSMAGLYCNHQDLSPKYASFLLGLTNTTGAIPGIVGVFITGWLLDMTDSWSVALFAPSIFFFIAGSIVFTLYGKSGLQSFSDNHPFDFEKNLLHYIPWRSQ